MTAMIYKTRLLNTFLICATLVLAVSLPMVVRAQVSVTTIDTPVVVNFEGFDGSGFDPSPQPGQLDSDNWVVLGLSDGDFDFGATQSLKDPPVLLNAGDFARGASTGGKSTGGIYAFDVSNGAGVSSIVALGVQPGGTEFNPGTLVLRLQNNTGGILTEFNVQAALHYFNNAGRTGRFSMLISSDGVVFSDLVPAQYVDTPAAADAIPEWVVTPVSATLSDQTIADGDFFYLGFTYEDLTGGSGSRDEIGVSVITITPRVSVECLDASACDDGDLCTTDACDDANACTHTAVDPSDGRSCTIDSCDPTTGITNEPNNDVCSDNDLCTGIETCDPAAQGADATTGCLSGTPVVIDDRVACTDDSCDPTTGNVSNVVNDSKCTDDLFCTGVEVCDAVSDCQPGTPPCSGDTPACDEASDACGGCFQPSDCDDGVFCNGVEVCVPATGCAAGTPPDLDDGVACTTDTCSEELKGAVHTPDDTACDDSDTCTAETCDASEGCSNPPTGCSISATCYADAAINPNNPCEQCDIAANAFDWTPVAEGTSCADAECNAAGEAVPAASCNNSGACVAPAAEACTAGCTGGVCNADTSDGGPGGNTAGDSATGDTAQNGDPGATATIDSGAADSGCGCSGSGTPALGLSFGFAFLLRRRKR